MSFYILFIAAYALVTFYVGLRAIQWLRLFAPRWLSWLFGLAYLVAAASLVIERIGPKDGWGRLAGHVRNTWLGLFAVTLLIVLAFDLLRTLWHLLRGWRKTHPLTGRSAIWSGVVILALIAAIAVYASWNARQIRVVQETIKIAKPADVSELQVVLASDLHMGLVMDAERLQVFVDAVNAQKPDLILLAGDLFDGTYADLAEPERAAAVLGQLQAPDGVYAILGNHDAGEDLDQMLTLLRQARIRVLLDETVTVRGILLAGRLDRSPIGAQLGKRKDLSDLLSDVSLDQPVVLLDHNPLGLADARIQPVDLMLSGHTHNGQIWPGSLIVSQVYENGYGRLDSAGLTQLVTSGVGTWGPPWRIASQSEIVSIRLIFTGS